MLMFCVTVWRAAAPLTALRHVGLVPPGLGILGVKISAAFVGAVTLTALVFVIRVNILFKSGKIEARAEAIRLGIAVEEIERELPVFDDCNTVHLERDWCVRYSVERQPGRLPAEWSFLQRTKNEGAQYPHGWLFVSPLGAPSPGLEQVLVRIADEWTEELLEFESTSSEVSAFWEEWGGCSMVTKIHDYLQQLARA